MAITLKTPQRESRKSLRSTEGCQLGFFGPIIRRPSRRYVHGRCVALALASQCVIHCYLENPTARTRLELHRPSTGQ